MEFDDFRKDYENTQESSVDLKFLKKVNEKMGKYQMEGREYLKKVCLFCPYQADLLRHKRFVRGYHLHK